MTRLFSIIITILAAVTAAAAVRLPSGAEQFGSLDNVVAYFQRVNKPWRLSTFFRNIQTMIGRTVAGNGMPYEIRIYGTAKLKRKNF